MTKGAIKAIAIGVSALLIGATVTAGVGSAKGGKPFQNPHIETWFNNWGKPAAQEQAQTWGGVIDDVGNELNAETTYAMPAAMAFYSTISDDVAQNSRLSSPSVTVTCSHNFEFNNVYVDWSVEYPSGASAADIVTVTPTSDGSCTANVSCTAPAGFDTQLTLKATLRGNEEKTATCTIDYIRRISTFNQISINGTDLDDNSGLSCYPIFGTGTVKGTLRVKSVTWNLTSDFENKVKSYLKFPIKFTYHQENDKILNDKYYDYDGDTLTYSMFIENFDDYDQAHKNAIYYAWWTAYNSDNYKQYSNVILDVEIELLYNGNVIQTYSESEYLGGASRNSLSGEVYGIDLAPDLTLNGNIAL